jgi:drug/metabolite transporter (DMT)-like permease
MPMLGEILSIASALAWAIGVVLYKRLGETLPPLRLNLLKNGIVLATLVPITLAWHAFAPPSLSTMDVLVCLVSGALGIGIADTLYFRALNHVGAGRMGIVGNCYSPFVIVLAFVFLGERLTLLQIAGFGLVTLGVIVIAERRHDAGLPRGELLRGLALGVVAVFLMACAIVMVKPVLERADLLWVSLIRMAGGVAIMLVVVAFARVWYIGGGGRLDGRGIGLLVLAALVGQLLSMLLWLGGYKYTTASVAAILNETSSVFIVVLAWLVLREPMTRRKLAGIGCTLAGVALMLG